MRGLSAGLWVFAGSAAAHSGHGAAEGHFHGLGVEHFVLFAVVAAVLAFAVRK